MSKTAIVEVGIGAALIGAAFITGGGSLLAASALTSALASTGAGFVLSGIGTLLNQQATGINTTSRNAISPWQVVFGRTKVGATVTYQEEVASNNRILLLVCTAAAHASDAIEEVWLNNRKVQFEIDSTYTDEANPYGFQSSIEPPQAVLNLQSITRIGDVVEVVFQNNPSSPYADFDGETIWIRGTVDSAGGDSMNGYFPVTASGPNSFTYLCGGVAQGPGLLNTGSLKSTWAQDGIGNVVAGYYLGDQINASGIILGNTLGYWTPLHVQQGRTYIALKLTYDSTIFNGMPEISFVMRGKNDIYDPRTGQRGYTNNAALCIADYLNHPLWGFGASYGTEIPDVMLIAAANICDEPVQLALGGTEPRYACNGSFDVSVKRGEVLQNLLTSCGGRLTYVGGQFSIQPAAWTGPVDVVTGDGSSGPAMMMSADGLVAHSYANTSSSRQSFLPDSAGTAADQFLFALGMLAAHSATGNNIALALANRALSPILPVLFQGRDVPPSIDGGHSFAPHWLYNVKQPFVAADVRYDDQFQFSNGSCVIPDTYGEVRIVFQATTVGAVLQYVAPYAPVKSGTAYAIAGCSYESGVGTLVKLATPFNGTLCVIYSCLEAPAIYPGELFDNDPDWRALGNGETDCAGDSLNWAYRLFAGVSETLEGIVSSAGYGSDYGFDYGNPTTITSAAGLAQYSQIARAILQQANYSWDVDDSRDWIKPSTIQQPFSQAGSALTGSANPDPSCNDAGDLLLAFVGDGATGSSATYEVSGLGDHYNTGDSTIVTLGTDVAQSVTVFVDAGSTRYSTTLAMAGTGLQTFILPRQIFFSPAGAMLAAGTSVAGFGVTDSNVEVEHTLTIRRITQLPNRAITYLGGMVPWRINFDGVPSNQVGWTGPIYIGAQSPWLFKQAGNEAAVAVNVQLLADAQAAYALSGLAPETIRFVVTGANPQTIDLPVGVDALGDGSCALTYVGANLGTDTIEAFLDAHSLNSNSVKVEWSSLPSGIALNGDVYARIMAADGTGDFHSGPESTVVATASFNSLMFNTHPQSLFPGDPHESGNQANPMVNNATTSIGGYAGDVTIPASTQPADMAFTGAFIVTAAGNISFSAYVNSSFVMGVEGASYVSGPQFFGVPVTPFSQLPPLVGFNGDGAEWPGGNWAQENFTLHFPGPGIYPFEIDFSSGLFSEKQFVLLAGGAVIRQAGSASAATGTAGSGDLILAPVSGGQWLGESTTIQLAISGVSEPAFESGPFVPVFYPDRADLISYGTKDTFGYVGPDPDGLSAVYQVRPMVETAELVAACAGTESYYSQAEGVVNNLLEWFDTNWSTGSVNDGPPSYFPQTGPTVVAPDPHTVAMLLRALLTMDMVARPLGNTSGAMNSTYASLLTKTIAFYTNWYQATGAMWGTFCPDASTNMTWYGYWHGEILRALSLLYSWATGVHIADSTKAADALTWINGLVGWANNNVQTIDSDLGYTVGDLAGGIRWQPKLGRVNLYNGIKGTYKCQATQWVNGDFPSYAQDELHGYVNGSPSFDYDANWTADGDRLWKDIQLPFTTSCSMAQRLAKIELMRIRQQGRGSLQGMMSMYQSTALDIVPFSYKPFGWTNKLLEVGVHRLTFDKVNSGKAEVTLIGVQMDIQETDPSVYEWDVTEELSPYGQSYIPALENLAPEA